MIAACLAFYSPCGYTLPRKHLARTLAWLKECGAHAVLCQVVRPGQEPQPVPAGFVSAVYESDDVMWFKENLWNLAATHTSADKLLFLDADVRFDREDVLPAVERLLEDVDVCQPYETASWLDREGNAFQTRKSAAFAICGGEEPLAYRYHAGFAWAMTRRAFNALGGFYDLKPLGGGDVAFSYSLDERWVAEDCNASRRPSGGHNASEPKSLEQYRCAAAAKRLRVGYLRQATAYHSWHGEIQNRQYLTRPSLIPLAPGDEFPLRRRADGLLEWTDRAAAAAAMRYFAGRLEDG